VGAVELDAAHAVVVGEDNVVRIVVGLCLEDVGGGSGILAGSAAQREGVGRVRAGVGGTNLAHAALPGRAGDGGTQGHGGGRVHSGGPAQRRRREGAERHVRRAVR